jgi:hypothetical protein
MPELPVKEGRLSELHLPEISRDDIVRSLSEIRMPEVDLGNLELPKFDRPSVDIGKALAGAAAAAHIGRSSRRSRWPLAVGGLIIAGVATAAILGNQSLRARLGGAVEALRERLMAMRPAADGQLEMDSDDPIAFSAAETAPITPLSHADGETTDVTGYPEGLGAGTHTDKADESPLEPAVTRD